MNYLTRVAAIALLLGAIIGETSPSPASSRGKQSTSSGSKSQQKLKIQIGPISASIPIKTKPSKGGSPAIPPIPKAESLSSSPCWKNFKNVGEGFQGSSIYPDAFLVRYDGNFGTGNLKTKQVTRVGGNMPVFFHKIQNKEVEILYLPLGTLDFVNVKDYGREPSNGLVIGLKNGSPIFLCKPTNPFFHSGTKYGVTSEKNDECISGDGFGRTKGYSDYKVAVNSRKSVKVGGSLRLIPNCP